MNYRKMTSPCGLDCFNCPIYRASDNRKLREEISKKRGIPFEKARCRGCRNEGGIIVAFDMTKPCRVYECIEGKGLDLCCDCTDFPCDYLHPYADKALEVAHNTKVFNLCLIKKMGLEAWATTKAESVGNTYFKGRLRL